MSQLASYTDPLGHTVAFEYDDKGSVSSVTDPLGSHTTLHSIQRGSCSLSDSLGNTTHFIYELGDVVGMTNPLGDTTTRYIDSAGRPIILTDSLAHGTQYAYDALNQLVQVVDSTATGPLWPIDIAGWRTSRGYAATVGLPRLTDRLSRAMRRRLSDALAALSRDAYMAY